jgi:hypothetical protein
VAHVLLNKGRLNLAEICHYTKLKSRSAQGVVIALIQHNLVWHSEVAQGEKLVEYFEFNLKECLLRLRWGRILALTEDEFGSDVSPRRRLREPGLISDAGNAHCQTDIRSRENETARDHLSNGRRGDDRKGS